MAVTNVRRWMVAGAISLIVLFTAIILRSILQAGEAYDSYPQYSSFNNQGDGTKAYFEALHRLGYHVERNHQALRDLASAPSIALAESTVLYLGPTLATFRSVPENTLASFERLAQNGTR